jgi:hypothetical protein
MAKTRTPGITVLADGRLFIDKRHLGIRIGLRVGAITQEQAEERLRVEMTRIEYEQERKKHARPTFADCAARYVTQSRGKRSIDVIKWHVQLLARYIGYLEPRQIHDATLEPFIKDRLGEGASATTVNRTLEVVRTILNRAARSYRDADGRPWLDAIPPLISMLPEDSAIALSAQLGGTGPALSPTTPSPRPHGTVRDQHRLAPEQPLRLAMDVGSSRARNSQERVRHPCRGLQDQTPACRDPQRRGLVDHQGATRVAPDLGISVSRQTNR